MPFNHTDIIDDKGPHPLKLFETENMLMDLMVKSEETNVYKEALASVKFDGGLSDFFMYSTMIHKT